MKDKKIKIIVSTCVLIFIMSCVWILLMRNSPEKNTVEILQNGEILYEIDLVNTKDQTIEVRNGKAFNIIKIENNNIHMSDASCPDKTCIHIGELENNGVPIVCLPNKIIIQYKKGSSSIDATAY